MTMTTLHKKLLWLKKNYMILLHDIDINDIWYLRDLPGLVVIDELYVNPKGVDR